MATPTELLEKLLNPDVVKSKILSAGMFLIAHEVLEDSIVRHPLWFFANKYTAKGPEESDKYKKEILERDPRKKNDRLRGSIEWLVHAGVIEKRDARKIREIRDARNQLAHELRDLVSGGAEPAYLDLFQELYRLVDQIEKWWIVNVELALSENETDHEIGDEDVIPGSTLLLHLVSNIALSEPEQAWEFHKEFQKLKNGEQ